MLYAINPAIFRDGIRSEWEAEAEIDFQPRRYLTAETAREGVRVWGEVCKNSERAIASARANGNTWFANRETVMLAGHRAELAAAEAALIAAEMEDV